MLHFELRSAVAPATLLVIDDQAVEYGFEECAKSPFTWISIAEVASYEAKGELLKDLVRGVFLPERRQQVAASCTSVPLEEFVLSGPRDFRSIAMCLTDH